MTNDAVPRPTYTLINVEPDEDAYNYTAECDWCQGMEHDIYLPTGDASDAAIVRALNETYHPNVVRELPRVLEG